MSDTTLRSLARHAVGQPECAQLLVAAGRAKQARGLVVTYWPSAWDGPIAYKAQAIYPLFDGSGWHVLTAAGTGIRVEDPNIKEVHYA